MGSPMLIANNERTVHSMHTLHTSGAGSSKRKHHHQSLFSLFAQEREKRERERERETNKLSINFFDDYILVPLCLIPRRGTKKKNKKKPKQKLLIKYI